MTAIGYIRQSRRADLDVALFYDAQLAAIHRLAESDRVDPDRVEILSDMGRSGARGKERFRPAYRELVERVKAGSVDAVYSLSMSRLARSIVELHSFFDIAKDHGVRIVFDKDRYDLSTSGGRLTANVLASVCEFERDIAVERAKDNVAVRRSRGERMGRAPYGSRPGDDPAMVRAAFTWTGSFTAAARWLNDHDIKSHLGRGWTGTAVRLVIERHDPDALPPKQARGRREVPAYVFWHLLRCPCGAFLTGSTWRGRRVYRCHRAEADRSHPRPAYIAESTVRVWAEPEAERFLLPAAAEIAAQDARRVELEAERARIVHLFTRGTIDEPTMDVMLRDVDEGLEALDLTARIRHLPASPIGWEMWRTEDIGTVLRTLWAEIRLEHRDGALRPVTAEWRIPAEWLA